MLMQVKATPGGLSVLSIIEILQSGVHGSLHGLANVKVVANADYLKEKYTLDQLIELVLSASYQKCHCHRTA